MRTRMRPRATPQNDRHALNLAPASDIRHTSPPPISGAAGPRALASPSASDNNGPALSTWTHRVGEVLREWSASAGKHGIGRGERGQAIPQDARRPPRGWHAGATPSGPCEV